jgi:hypothetical protein
MKLDPFRPSIGIPLAVLLAWGVIWLATER